MGFHIGQAIKAVIETKGLSKTWFAENICQDRTNVYKIFKKGNIDIKLLMRVSIVLQHDFFKDLSEQMQSTNNNNTTQEDLGAEQ